MRIETAKGFSTPRRSAAPTDGDEKAASACQIDRRCLALGVTFVILIAGYKCNNETTRHCY
jgi:hypothetical protein